MKLRTRAVKLACAMIGWVSHFLLDESRAHVIETCS